MAEEGEGEIKYLALGDSYTIGEAVESSGNFPHVLAERLRRQTGREVQVEIIATTGWTTGDLQRAVAARAPREGSYDAVSLLIGVNNQYQGRGLEEYRQQFAELFAAAQRFAKKPERLFVVSIPDYGYTPFGLAKQQAISEQLDRFNAFARDHSAAQQSTDFCDITPISRQGLDVPALVAPDQLHPSSEMYRRWVDDVIFPIIQHRFSK
ncbi:MAG: SGNH/GDSL hydrolase family protein [archaeon]|nr:SGNH/GDSL hydrolase family protein [archaeon]